MKNIIHNKSLTGLFLLLILLTIFIFSCRRSPDAGSKNLVNESANKEKYLEWFRNAKFGMMIHWGPYSMMAGEWNGRQVEVGRNAEWIMSFLRIPVDEYRRLAHDFNPVKFNAREYVQLAKETGMKYIVITAKHHDGFAMYHSKVSKYNIMDWTKFGRDPLKELSDECARTGIKFCVYYSHHEDWEDPGAYGNDWDYDNKWRFNDLYHHEKFNKYLEAKAKPQLRELLTGYGPIGLVWFDRGMYTPEQGKEFVDLVHGLQPAALVNSRVGNYNQEALGDYQSTSDNGMPPGGLEDYWETPQTLNETWGFSKFDTRWKTPETVIRRLVEIVSRGGNYLLNIGPTGKGEIPAATIDIFKQVGPWVERNTEAIYGTTANPFPEIPWGYCTVKGNLLYLFIRDWPEDGTLKLSGLKNKVNSSYFLLDKSKKLQREQNENVIKITITDKPVDNPITVLVLEIDGTPRIDQPIVPEQDTGTYKLNYLNAITNGKAVTRFNVKGKFHISKMTCPADSVNWIIRVTKPGTYRVNLSYAANREWEGSPFEISCGTSFIRTNVICTGDWYDYQDFPVGYFNFTSEGDYSVAIRPKKSMDTYLMYLNSITLSRVQKVKKEGWGVN